MSYKYYVKSLKNGTAALEAKYEIENLKEARIDR